MTLKLHLSFQEMCEDSDESWRWRFHKWIITIALTLGIACTTVADELPPSRLASITKKLRTGDPVVIATFGDSITWPCYHTDYQQNYITFTVDALRKAYPKANVRIIHAGNMGSTGRGLTDGRFEMQVLAHKPDMVFIMFGMNDCGSGYAGLDAYDANLSKLIQQTRSADALPIIATQNEILYEQSNGRQALPQYMARALDVAKRENVPAVDCFELWQPLTKDPARLVARLNDWIHPNHAGHRLIASAIVAKLWPEALEYVSTEERTPLKPEESESTPCLLAGPSGKQILRTADGTWYAISGRRRNQRLTDLVFSFSRAERPTWQEFRHITLVGPRNDADFDAMDRTLTAGMLLERDGRVYVVFSWNVGVFFVTTRQPTLQLDLTKPPQVQAAAAEEWEKVLAMPKSWLQHTDEPFVRPTIVANCLYRYGALLYDAYLQSDGWPAVLCSERQIAPGGGFEVVNGVDGIGLITHYSSQNDPIRKMLFPEFQVARCLSTSDGNVYYAAQKTHRGPLQLGKFGSELFTTTKKGANQFLLSANGPAGNALVFLSDDSSTAEHGKWLQLTWEDPENLSVEPIVDSSTHSRENPLLWCDGSKSGIAWCKSSPRDNETVDLAFESQPPRGANTLGVLSAQNGQIKFHTLPIRQ